MILNIYQIGQYNIVRITILVKTLNYVVGNTFAMLYKVTKGYLYAYGSVDSKNKSLKLQ